MPSILCLHTADVHCATFGKRFAEAAPEITLDQQVRAEWLAEARETGLTDGLVGRVRDFLEGAARTHDAVLCTCSTLGPIATEVAARRPNVIRIDWPLMQAAAACPGPALVAICLESTREATLALLDAAFHDAGRQPDRQLLLCADAWPCFERGDMAAFAETIANFVSQSVRAQAARAPVGCVLLAQASMAAAEPLLQDLGVPVFSSPGLAVDATLRAAR